MKTVVARLLGASLAVAACAGPGSGSSKPGPVGEPQLTCDPGRKGLSMEDELACLLSGRAQSSSVRLAIAPLEVAGDRDAWLGDAVSALLSSRIARYEGVSVLERGELSALIDELERGGSQQDVAAASQKILGVEYMVMGQLIPESKKRYRAVLRPVRVASSEIVQPLEFQVTLANPAGEVDQVVEALRAQLSLSQPQRADASASLSPAALELASRAMQARARGELAQASELYLKALPKVTSAFAFELDLIDLMEDLRLIEWAYERGKKLKDLHYASLSACHRARLFGALADAAEDLPRQTAQAVDYARDAIAHAKVCGDAKLSAHSLVMYARVLEHLDVPAAQKALDHAEPLVGGAQRVRCEIEFERAWLLENHIGASGDTPLTERWQRVEKLCAGTGHSVPEVSSIRLQSNLAPGELERVALLQKAYERSKRIGGKRLDSVAIALSAALGKSGKPVEASDLVLEQIASVVGTLMRLHGGVLTGPEATIDGHLLSRMGIDASSIGAPPQLAKMQTLLVKGHRSRLAVLLRHWADNFEPESYGQADLYRVIARQLDGSDAPPPDESPEAALARKLADAGTSLEELEGMDGAPVRGSAMDVEAAQSAVTGWFYALDSQKHAERKRAVALAVKTAAWLGSPAKKAFALRASAIQKANEQCPECFSEAVVAIKEAQSLVALPQLMKWHQGTHVWLLRRFGRDDDAQPIKAAEIATLRQVSEVEWIDAVAAEAKRLHGRDNQAATKYAESLAKLTVQYSGDQRFWLTSYLLQNVAQVVEVFASRSFNQSIQFRYMSLDYARKVGDPSLIAERAVAYANAVSSDRGTTYGGRARHLMKEDSEAERAAHLAYQAIAKLAASNRYRDALMQLLGLSYELPGYSRELLAAQAWLEQLRLSKRHPLYRGLWLEQRASASYDSGEKDRLLAEAAEEFARGKFHKEAVRAYSRRAKEATTASAMLGHAETCMQFAKEHGIDVDECTLRIYAIQKTIGCEEASDEDRKRLASIMKDLAQSREKWLSSTLFNQEASRAHQERNLAVFYLLAGDENGSQRFAEAASKRYQAAKDLYSRAQLYDQLAIASGVRCDYKGLIRHTDSFLESKGAGLFFEAYVVLRAYRAALIAGDAAAARFKARGERAARRADPSTYASFALTDAYLALRDRRFTDAATHLGEAIARNEAWAPSYVPRIERLRLEQATALALAGDTAGARGGLDKALGALGAWPHSADIPGSMSRRMAHAAVLANSLGRCDEARALIDRARDLARKAPAERVELSSAEARWLPRGVVWTEGQANIEFAESHACKQKVEVTKDLFGSGTLFP